jgi:hypothetical protein
VTFALYMLQLRQSLLRNWLTRDNISHHSFTNSLKSSNHSNNDVVDLSLFTQFTPFP